MANRPFRFLTLGVLCTMLAMGCNRPESSTPSTVPVAAPVAAAEPTTAKPSTTEPAPETLTPQPERPQAAAPPPPKPLNLSRGSNLDALGSANDTGGKEPGDLLPDLFKDKSRAPRTRTSGRLLMSETEKASMQAVEGVEFKLEIPVN